MPFRLLSQFMAPRRKGPLKGVTMTLSDKAIEEARALLKESQVPTQEPVLFLNPDTASNFTRVPFDDQVDLLKRLVQMPGRILLGTAFVERGIEARLIERLEPNEREKVAIVPTSLSLDGYTALIDFSDVFISGDTGPLHMAAARKVSRSGNFKFRNKTFVVSIFGATPARYAGYDSKNPLYMPANQDVQSRVYISESSCRNVTCVNKMYKTCKTIRCFEVLDVENIAVDIKLHLAGLLQKSSKNN
jgi:ADP-heptose:LPS heptosyltransferase